ncbi:unnamed protein product [Jaminaea pallidilutea]
MDRLKSVNDALSGVKPFSSVSVWFDRLTANNFAEDDYEGIPELVESINLQASGPAEASRCVRKKLKYGSVHGQKRAIVILGYLVENCGPRFQTTFADERLVNQIKLVAADPLVDASVRRKLMRLLLSWQQTFSNEPTMRTAAGLYAACGGGRARQEREAQRKRSEAEELYRKQEELRKREMQIRMDRKTAEKMQKEEDKKKSKKGVKGQPRRFNYEQEKPQILNHLAVSSRSATNLVNALQHVNRETESVSTNVRVQQCLNVVKMERKQLVRYIQLVQDEEMVGALIEANDRIMIALQLYDKLASPSHDSDDEDGAGATARANALIDAGSQNRATVEQRAAAEDAEIEAVRRRLESADMDSVDEAGRAGQSGNWEGEIEKLQYKQRRGIERHNSRVSIPRGGGASGGAIKDLLDLDFDDTTSSMSAGPSLRPNRNSSVDSSSAGAATAGTHASSSTQQHGSLSDYSDYDSSEDEEERAQQQQQRSQQTTAGAGAGGLAPPQHTGGAGSSGAASSASSAVLRNHGAELESWRVSRHRPRIGEETSSLWSKEDEERWIRGEDDEDDLDAAGAADEDPFGDEWEEVADRLRKSGAEPGRQEWAAV